MKFKQLKEWNSKVDRAVQGVAQKQLNESIRRQFGMNLEKKTEEGERFYDFSSPLFSFRKYQESAYKLAESHGRFQEAQTETIWNQLLRAGINNIAMSWYNLAEKVHDSIAMNVTSDKAIELYAPVSRATVPRRVGRSEPYPEATIAGPDIQIANDKFGAIMAFESELFKFDQTGIVQMRASQMGEGMVNVEDVWSISRLFNTAITYGGDTTTTSQTKPSVESNWPYSTSFSQGGGANKFSAFNAFSSQNVQNLHVQQKKQKDQVGNYLMVTPNVIVVGPDLEFSVRTLLQSEWYPSTGSMAAATTGGADTQVGGPFARNVLQGLYDMVVSPFVPAKAWVIGEAGKGYVFQRAEATEVVQENPQSGPAFSTDIYRFKVRGMWVVDFVEPRFWALGNDGSV